MTMIRKQPKLLKKHPNAFQVEWKDGHVSWYPYTYLRQMCPCAECAIIRHKGRDIHSLFAPEGDGDITLIEVSADIQPLDVQLVGRYALQFSWSDGHNTGIYPFEVLRETCPCPKCAPLTHQQIKKENEAMQTEPPEISPRELKQRLAENESLLLLDVREQIEYDIVHLEGARLIPLNTLPQHVESLPTDREIVVYCHHGQRSLYAAAYLHQNGFENVKNLRDGIDGWAVDVEPTLRRY